MAPLRVGITMVVLLLSGVAYGADPGSLVVPRSPIASNGFAVTTPSPAPEGRPRLEVLKRANGSPPPTVQSQRTTILVRRTLLNVNVSVA